MKNKYSLFFQQMFSEPSLSMSPFKRMKMLLLAEEKLFSTRNLCFNKAKLLNDISTVNHLVS